MIFTEKERIELIDYLEQSLVKCKRSYSDRLDWCNVCGASKSYGIWLIPHHRDIIVKAVFKMHSDDQPNTNCDCVLGVHVFPCKYWEK